MGIAELATGLSAGEHGIWRSARSAPISYPERGNEDCFRLEDGSYWFAHRNDCIVALLRAFPPPGPLLDVGGGNGYVTRRLLDEGFEATLLEPGPAGAWNGKVQRRLPEVICATLEDAAFAPATLSAAGCFDVVEHIPDDRRFLSSLHDVLVPDGLLYGTVPAHGWLWSRNDVTAEHHRRYDRPRLASLLRDTSFELCYFSYFFAPLVLPILLLRALPFRLGLSRRGQVLSDEAEHGTGGGSSVDILVRLLRQEARRIARGVESRLGASALFVARKRAGAR